MYYDHTVWTYIQHIRQLCGAYPPYAIEYRLAQDWTFLELIEFPSLLEDQSEDVNMANYARTYEENAIARLRSGDVPFGTICNDKRGLYKSGIYSIIGHVPDLLTSVEDIEAELRNGKMVVIKPSVGTSGGVGVKFLSYRHGKLQIDQMVTRIDDKKLYEYLDGLTRNCIAQKYVPPIWQDGISGYRAVIEFIICCRGKVCFELHSVVAKRPALGMFVDNYGADAKIYGVREDGLTYSIVKNTFVTTRRRVGVWSIVPPSVTDYANQLASDLEGSITSTGGAGLCGFVSADLILSSDGVSLLELNAKPGLGYQQRVTKPLSFNANVVRGYNRYTNRQLLQRVLTNSDSIELTSVARQTLESESALLSNFLNMKVG